MPAFGSDAKDQIRQAIDIVDLVGSYLPLRREGRGFKALCPWHDDSRPSLQINQQRQSFKCWVCDIGGDIFSFVMKMENVEFPEALELLAERAGIKLDRRGNSPGEGDERKSLYSLLAWAEDQFQRYLIQSPEAEIARRYFDDRGVTEESLVKYRLGFSPDSWDWLQKRAAQSGYSETLLDKAGLVNTRPGGVGCYDFFRGRALFPVRDPQGRTIAFGGRVLPQFAEKAGGKYINTRETPLFSKHKTLYGLDISKDAITRQKTALVMEGYTDCLMAWQFGIENCVAVLGTALGAEHLKLLKRYCERVVLVLDGDAAGQKRTNEILELLIGETIELCVLTLPEGLDPCDFLIERGGAAFRRLQESETVDALEHALRTIAEPAEGSDSPHAASVACEKLLTILAKATAGMTAITGDAALREGVVLGRLSRRFDIREETLRQRLRELRRDLGKKQTALEGKFRDSTSLLTGSAAMTNSDASEASVLQYEPLNQWPARELELLELLLSVPESVSAVAEAIAPHELQSPAAREFYTRILHLSAARQTPDFAALMNSLADERLKNLLVDLDERAQNRSLAISPEERLCDFLTRCAQDRTDREQRQRERLLREDARHDDDKMAILQQLIDEERRKRGHSLPTEG